MPLHEVSPGGHAVWHMPAMHTRPAPHAMPHPPQFAASVRRFTHLFPHRVKPWAALHWHWGIGGVWAGLAAFIAVRLVGMLARTRGSRWVILGVGT